MPIRNLADLPAFLTRGQTLLGLDYGEKRIGLAICDPDFSLASPLAVVERGKLGPTLAEIAKIMTERNVGALVIGLPLGLDGKDTPTTQAVRTFASNVLKAWPEAKVALWDERFSTAAVERQMIEVADMSRAKRGEVVDRAAAAYMLQGAIDYLRAKRA